MTNANTRHKARQRRRIVIEPPDRPGQQPPQRANNPNRERLATLRKRERYLTDLIEAKREHGRNSGYESAEANALRWAIQICAHWMTEEGEDPA